MSSSPSSSDSVSSARLRPASVDELVACIRQAVGERKVLALGRTLPEVDNRICQSLCLRSLDGVVDYPARDMTITVQAGMTFGQLDRLLLAENQQLPIDVADPEQTIGAVVAKDLYGPRRYGYGTLRDYLIGVEAVDGTGRVFHSGGRVVKNVAGYDLCRLLIGSRGTLAVLTQLTFKLKPRAVAEQLLLTGFRNLHQLDAALEQLNRSAARPVMIEVLNRSAAATLLSPLLDVRNASSGTDDESIAIADCPAWIAVSVEGTASTCEWQMSVLQNELQGTRHWQRLFPAVAAANADSVQAETFRRLVMSRQNSVSRAHWSVRLSTLPSRIVSTMTMLSADDYDIFGRAGNGVLYICSAEQAGEPGNRTDGNNTAETVLKSEAECLRLLRGVIADEVGSLQHLRSGQSVSAPASTATLDLMQKLKAAFDPEQIFAAAF